MWDNCSKGMNGLDTGYEIEIGSDGLSGTQKYHMAFLENLKENKIIH